MSKKQVSLEVINPYAAGIDIGSRSHWVAVGQDAQDVKEFGVYTEDYQELSKWLKVHKVTTIAMESTGTYWQNIFSFLVAQGFEVILVNGRQTKNIKGKKIISAFINGEKSGEELAKHRHYNIRKSEEEIAKALQYNGREDYFFALKQEWKTYLHLQKQIDETDKEIKKLLKDIIKNDDNKKKHTAKKKPISEKTKMP